MRIHLDGGIAIEVKAGYQIEEIGRVIIDDYDVRVFGTMGGLLLEVNCYPNYPYSVELYGLGLFSQRNNRRALTMSQQAQQPEQNRR